MSAALYSYSAAEFARGSFCPVHVLGGLPNCRALTGCFRPAHPVAMHDSGASPLDPRVARWCEPSDVRRRGRRRSAEARGVCHA